jgi:tripartite-type tricarboxylate transporter receptor subunit TctC
MRLAHALVAFAMASTAGTCAAQAFPNHPIKLIVGFAPGGGSDFVARAIATELSGILGQSVVVDNRAGAGGAIAARTVSTAEPDGYTLLLGSAANFVINPLLVKTLPYDPADFAPVGAVARFDYVLMARKDLPVESVADIVALARKSPGSLTIGSAGNGSNTHLAAAAFMTATGTELRHIPYKGTSPALVDLMGSKIDLLFDSVPTVLGQVQSGALRAVAVSGNEREAILPNLPTIAESGFRQFSASNWFAIFAPKGTPADVVAKLNAGMQKALATASLRAQFDRSGNRPLPGTPSDLANLVANETATYRTLITASKITLD